MKNIKGELVAFLENVGVKSVSLKGVSFKVSELLEDNENIEMEVKLKNKIPTEIQNEISILYDFRENARLRRESINISKLSEENLKKVKEAGKRILQVQEK
ncbi:MAG: hypothetical protein N3D14_00430 [Aquificaceae bacterium]|nr:hypothetical protein [Aquificaceae bacterium]MCX8163844.1 hypothetical protein [Aquificaceae bacterium]